MTWYTFKDWIWTSGPQKGQLKIYNVTGIDNLELEATGAHGYPTKDDSLRKPNAFPSAAQEALLALFSAQAAFPIGGGVGGAQTPTPSATAGAKNALDKSLSFAVEGSGFAGWFFRGLKILFGGILMIIGIGKLLNVDNKLTTLAGKVVPLPV